MAILSTLVAALSLAAPSTFVDEFPRRGYLGVGFKALSAEQRKQQHLKADLGVVALAPTLGSTAHKAGLKEGDILLELAGKEILPGKLQGILREQKPGQLLSMKVLRDGKAMQLSANLQETPRDPGSAHYEVVYKHIVSHGKRMRTIITRPKSPGKHPGFFFIQGFSPVSYDFTLEGSTGSVQTINGPLLFDFAQSGYVTMRVEKPGVGDSEGGPFAELDYTTELDIYRQALKQLKEVPTVDLQNIFIFGHSMGGAFGPMVAAESPVKGIVTYGTAARTWFEYLMDTVRYQPLVGGESFENVDETSRHLSRVLAQIFLERKSAEEVKKALPAEAALIDAYFPGGLFNGKALEFWRQLNDTNFPRYWREANCYVLAVRGASDFVTYDADHKLIADVVNRAHAGWGEFKIAPASDHLMHHFETEAESMRNFQFGKFSMEFSNMMKKWITQTIQKPAPQSTQSLSSEISLSSAFRL